MITARKLRNIRLDRLMSQTELAELADLTIQTVSRLELGQQSPRFQTLRKLAKALGVDATELIDKPANRRGRRNVAAGVAAD